MLEALNKQTIQAEKRRKGNLIIMAHSVCLEQGLLDESMLPTLESGCASIKDSVISLLSNKPGTQHENLHEEGFVELAFGFLHNLMKGDIEVLGYAQVIPALPIEGAGEE
jgi:hypothetical protein